MRDYKLLAEGLRYCSKHICNKECGYYEICHRDRGKEYPSVTSVGFDAADAIEELLAKVPTWISVEERLPEENKQIISYLAYKGMSVLQYENKHFYMQGAFQPLPKEAVTHWMPLPAPPKGGNHDN